MTLHVYDTNGKQVGYINEDNIDKRCDDDFDEIFRDLFFEEFPFAFLYATKDELETFERIFRSWAAGLDDSDYYKFHIEPEFTEMPLNTIYIFDDGVCDTVSEHLARAKRQLKFYTDLSSHVQSPLKKTLPH